MKYCLCFLLRKADEQPDGMDDPIAVSIKTPGGNNRREQSIRRNKWVRDKYDIHGSVESLDTAKGTKCKEKLRDSSQHFNRSLSFGGRTQKNRKHKDIDEAKERNNSKRLRESIRTKYNLPRRDVTST